jgi:site-specific recombinase XerD
LDIFCHKKKNKKQDFCVKLKTKIKMVKNLIKSSYNVLSTNYVICIDITSLGIYGELFLMVDLASRCIIGHCYSSTPLDTSSILETIDTAKRRRAFLPSIEIIHSDRGTIFRNKMFEEHILGLGVKLSRGSAEGHDNQVVERLNRTLKENIRRRLNPDWQSNKAKKLKDWDPLVSLVLSVEDFGTLVEQEISAYNSRPHRSLPSRTSPNEMEEALFKKHGGTHPALDPMLCETKSLELSSFADYQRTVVEDFRGDWQAFFLTWRAEQQQWQKEATRQLSAAREELEKANKSYESLYEQYLGLQKQLDAVYEDLVKRQREEQLKDEGRLKRKQAKKQKLRQTVTPSEFGQLMGLVQGRSALVRSRRRLALLLLYLTGLRVSNLLLLTSKNARELAYKGCTTISLIKGGAPRFRLHIGKEGRKLLRDKKLGYLSDIEILTANKEVSSYLFSSPGSANVPLDRSLFDRELNKILERASVLFQKHVRTHSFRATVITDLLENSVPIDQVKELIGHRSIATTLEYKRSRLSDSQIKSLLSQRELRKDSDLGVLDADGTELDNGGGKSWMRHEMTAMLT